MASSPAASACSTSTAKSSRARQRSCCWWSLLTPCPPIPARQASNQASCRRAREGGGKEGRKQEPQQQQQLLLLPIAEAAERVRPPRSLARFTPRSRQTGWMEARKETRRDRSTDGWIQALERPVQSCSIGLGAWVRRSRQAGRGRWEGGREEARMETREARQAEVAGGQQQ